VTLSSVRQRVAEADGECACGCASFDLHIDRSVAPRARQDLPFDLVSAYAFDLQFVNRRQCLTVVGDDGNFDESLPLPHNLEGAIGLILFIEEGWISGLEIWNAGDFRNPEMFPPADVFGFPEVSTPSQDGHPGRGTPGVFHGECARCPPSTRSNVATRPQAAA
jgi:hypothetical protein